MPNDLEHSRIEQQKRELIKQGAETVPEEIHRLHEEHYDVPRDFAGASITPQRALEEKIATGTPFSMKLLRAFAFFALLSAVSAFAYFGYQFIDPSNRPSPENIVVAIDMPVGASPSDPVDIVVHLTNKNNVALDSSDITLALPPGSYSKENGVIVPVHEEKTSLGMLMAGQTAEYRVRAYILGQEQQVKTVTANVDYRFINMDAHFTKSATKDIRMLASPVVLAVDSLDKVSPGQTVTDNITVRSNTEVPLQNMIVTLDYPLGFVYQGATPRPTSDDDLWVVPQLGPSDVATIAVNGMLTNEGADARVIHAQVGESDPSNPQKIASAYQTAESSIALEHPFVAATLTFDDKSADKVVAKSGVSVSAVLELRNTSATPVTHATVEVDLSGTGLDSSSVNPGKNGIYRKDTSSITWDERSANELARLDPGQFVLIPFSFIPSASRVNGTYVPNPQVVASVIVNATREDVAGVASQFKSLAASVLKVGTQADFAARALHYSGAFTDGGPMPPVVDKQTQFTVVWDVHNASNEIDGATVVGGLPPQAQWAGMVDPPNENIHYDPSTHLVTWTIGTVPAGAGIGSVPPKETSFQLLVTPTKDQVGGFSPVIQNQEFVGTDAYTQQKVSLKQHDLTTSLDSDPQAPRSVGLVQAGQ